MTNALKLALAALILLFHSIAANATTRIIVLPADSYVAKAELEGQLTRLILGLTTGDRLLVYAAEPFAQIAAIARPEEPNLNNARIKARFAAQFAPVDRYLSALPQAQGTPSGHLLIPQVMDELVRNVISAQPDHTAQVLLLGSLRYFDRRDGRWSMLRHVPSDGMLQAAREESPFSIVGENSRLSNVTVHYCSPGDEQEYVSASHAERLRRWWSLWTTGQGGQVGTFSNNLAICFARLAAGASSGQPTYQLARNSRPEMQRVPIPQPANLPARLEEPGEFFLREDAPISHTPPSRTVGVAWVGIRWKQAVDVDLWARGTPTSQWLYFGRVNTDEGAFNKDYQDGTGDAQFEFIAFAKPIDLNKAQVALNLYAGQPKLPLEGVLRVHFDGKIYEAPFRLNAHAGNHGAAPMKGPNWLSIDLRTVVGLGPRS